MNIFLVLIGLLIAGSMAYYIIKKRKNEPDNSPVDDKPIEEPDDIPEEPDVSIPTIPFRWKFNLKNKMHPDHELNCWNSGWNKKGFYSGAYTAHGGQGGDIRVFKSDENCENWVPWFTRKGNYESVSAFLANEDKTGINVLTEGGDGSELWWFPDSDPNQAQKMIQWDSQYMYGFAGTGCKKHGWAAICGNKDAGGRLARYDGGWKFFTPEFRDIDNHPMLIWDAIEFNGKIVCGGVRGKGEYHNLHAGSIGILENDNWTVRKLQPTGTAAIVQFNTLSTDPDYLYIATSYGEIWKTNDLKNFTKVFTSAIVGKGCDIYFYDVEGHPVCVSSKGLVYDCYKQVLNLKNEYDCRWISVIKPENGKKFLGGSFRKMSEEKGTYGVTLSYS